MDSTDTWWYGGAGPNADSSANVSQWMYVAVRIKVWGFEINCHMPH
jgi:hypothetical protein